MVTDTVPLAISYDFDGTLAPGNMQEHSFIPEVGMKKETFWREVDKLSKQHQGDNILIYLGLMLDRAKSAHVPVRRKDFRERGRNLDLYEGLSDWFKRINTYGQQAGVNVEHFVISSGIREMIAASPIGKEFRAIFASSYWYDENGVAQRPALALNYTTKTQYLFRINKGSLEVHDHSTINKYVPKAERPVPFPNMIFIGDGETDIPCFRLVKDMGGHSIAVYKPHAATAKRKAERLVVDGRVQFTAPADYRENRALDRIVKAIIDKLQIDGYLARLQSTLVST